MRSKSNGPLPLRWAAAAAMACAVRFISSLIALFNRTLLQPALPAR